MKNHYYIQVIVPYDKANPFYIGQELEAGGETFSDIAKAVCFLPEEIPNVLPTVIRLWGTCAEIRLIPCDEYKKENNGLPSDITEENGWRQLPDDGESPEINHSPAIIESLDYLRKKMAEKLEKERLYREWKENYNLSILAEIEINKNNLVI